MPIIYRSLELCDDLIHVGLSVRRLPKEILMDEFDTGDSQNENVIAVTHTVVLNEMFKSSEKGITKVTNVSDR